MLKSSSSTRNLGGRFSFHSNSSSTVLAFSSCRVTFEYELRAYLEPSLAWSECEVHYQGSDLQNCRNWYHGLEEKNLAVGQLLDTIHLLILTQAGRAIRCPWFQLVIERGWPGDGDVLE